jgi:preprotein translocase subunit SecF
MEFIKPGINLNFIGQRKKAIIISLILIGISIISLILHGGPKYGVDFAGGTLVIVSFEKDVGIQEVRKGIGELDLGASEVQKFASQKGSEYLIKLKKTTTSMEGIGEIIKKEFSNSFAGNNVEISKVQMVGPKVSEDMRRKGIWAVILAMGGILIYVTWRFEFKYATGAILALIHDVTITLGVFSILGKEITLPIVAALLTIIGYSLNDTIIVYDRIRENLKYRRKEAYEGVVNSSINQTLSRTILTSVTTMVVVLSLYIFGGGVIHSFAFALIIGIIIGTYSSIYIASPVLIFWEDKIAPRLEQRKRK